MRIKKTIRGICHWWEPECLIRSVGHRLDISYDNGDSFSTLCHLNYTPHKQLASKFRLGSRLLRTNPKHIIKLTPELFLIFAAGSIYQLNVQTGNVHSVASIVGSRPLRIAFDGKSLYYGQYTDNPQRHPISVYKSTDFGISWEICHEFYGIRHIHGMFYDEYSSSIWITTGDFGEEAAIWKADSGFSSVQKVVSGGQQTRAIDLLFDKDTIYFGTDAPDEQNRIYALSRQSHCVEQISQVVGPVFHASKVAGSMYFSTACEPSRFTTYTHAELLKITNSGIEKVAALKKDRWSMRYLQYGQILMPEGPGKDGQLWYSSFACQDDQFSFLLINE